MAIRPTVTWREGIEEERRLVANGVLEAEFAVTASFFPQSLLDRMDEIFEAFEQEIGVSSENSDEAILATVRRTVIALNLLNDDYNGTAIETSERDFICDYIDGTVVESGVDLDALCERQGLRRDELTDDWRTW